MRRRRDSIINSPAILQYIHQRERRCTAQRLPLACLPAEMRDKLSRTDHYHCVVIITDHFSRPGSVIGPLSVCAFVRVQLPNEMTLPGLDIRQDDQIQAEFVDRCDNVNVKFEITKGECR